jgi:putative restriction endonuclease
LPAVSPSTLINTILDAIQQSGGVGAYISRSARTHPRKFAAQYLNREYSIWVYIWTLTHGGRVNLPDEYRIQLTSVDSPFALNPDGYTVLMGYYPDLHMFAGFDLNRHRVFTPGSTSVQIGMSAIREALQNGLAFSVKTNMEIAVAVRPDQFLNYVLSANDLHRHGQDAQTLHLLQQAVRTEDISDRDISALARGRRVIVSSVSQYSRDANFRQQVLDAYGHRCAVTRAQLKLVEAAHILPVPATRSSEHVTNGIALSPTMHRAYDYGLIYLDRNHVMHLNDERIRELTAENRHAGLDQMRAFIPGPIHLPANPQQRPNPQYIEEANRYRRIPGYY